MRLEGLVEAIINGDMATAEAATTEALKRGIKPKDIMDGSMIPAMRELGIRFERGEAFIPEFLLASRAFTACQAVIAPKFVGSSQGRVGKVIIGTVEGDLHDIGKSMVRLMMEGIGFEVIDLGTDVGPDSFVAAIQREKPDVVAMSALLTTTMVNMEKIIQSIKAAGLREDIKVLVGGACVTAEFAGTIGADGYGHDASQGARMARDWVGRDRRGT